MLRHVVSLFVGVRVGDGEIRTQFGSNLHQRNGDIVAITDVGDVDTFDLTKLFVNGHNVGECLARMAVITEPIDDRDGCPTSKFQHMFVFKDACHDAVNHAVQNAGDIGNGFALAKPDLVW